MYSTPAAALGLFRNAAVVVGVHGAGLSNALFCRRGAALIELGFERQAPAGAAEPDDGDHSEGVRWRRFGGSKPHFAHLAAAAGLRYVLLGAFPPEAFAQPQLDVRRELAGRVRAAVGAALSGAAVL